METISRNGAEFRSKCLPEPKARQFAACLAANAQYTAVHVEESRRAKGEVRFFVAYQPASDCRYGRMVRDAQDTRLVRGVTEGQGYTFCADPDNLFWWCLSVSGEVYEVTERHCSCPDFYYRCQPCGLKCKHILALLNGVGKSGSW